MANIVCHCEESRFILDVAAIFHFINKRQRIIYLDR